MGSIVQGSSCLHCSPVYTPVKLLLPLNLPSPVLEKNTPKRGNIHRASDRHRSSNGAQRGGVARTVAQTPAKAEDRERVRHRLMHGPPSPALQRSGAVCTRNTSCTLVAPNPSTVPPPGIKMSLKRTAAPMPWRGVGIDGRASQRLASGSKASTCWNTPRGFRTLPSPPNTMSRSLTTAAATPDRGVGMGALVLQVRVRGSNSSRLPRVKLILLRPATAYSRPLMTPAPR